VNFRVEARRGERAEGNRRRDRADHRGELVVKSTGTVSACALDDRVFHQKFGNGNVTAIDG
jgi:DNA helicase II / ATP-dependent DNA helicase PcrA